MEEVRESQHAYNIYRMFYAGPLHARRAKPGKDGRTRYVEEGSYAVKDNVQSDVCPKSGLGVTCGATT